MGQHVNIKVSPSGDAAVVWFGDDETDLLHLEGPPGTVEAIARVLRANAGAVELEIGQRGSHLRGAGSFESDLTAAEKAAADKAAAKVKAEAEVASKADAIKVHLDAIEKARAELARIAPEALADADAIANASKPGDGAEIVAMHADDAISAIAKMDDVEALDRLGETEAASKNRKTVLAAVDARITEITSCIPT